MQPERWQQIDQLFHLALEKEGGQRAAFLAEACAGDQDLQSEIEELISSHEGSESFIETPASDLAAELLSKDQPGLKSGEVIGPYQIAFVLGIGGMGEVYLAQDTRLGRQVALKLLPPQFTIDPERVRRFEQEARAASALNHPNIVTIHEVGRLNSARFIVTEFVDGRTLRQLMSETRLSLHESLDVAIQIASALEAAHAAGIVHRDIKPENVMLRADGYVKLLDFGLAKLTEQPTLDAEMEARTLVKTNPGMVMGTVQYMSPEQARGKEVDARTDIWSLGVVLYEMVARIVPFDGETPSHVIVSLLEAEPPPIAHYSEVPADLERIVTKTLRKNREERYQRASDLVLDLKSLKQELQVEARLKESLDSGASSKESRENDESVTVMVEPVRQSKTRTIAVARPRPTSSAEYLVGEIRQHRRGVAFGLAALLFVVTGSIFLWIMNKSKPPAADTGMKTIAVLPFKPLAGDSRNESLELGMADTLINKLSGVSQLIVRPLSDVRKYTKLEQDPIAAGRELGADYVLEGNLQMVGDKTRTTVRLLRVKDGSAIWTDKCDQECSTVFELQDAIAERLAGTLVVKLTGEDRKQLAKHYTDDPEAYRLYNLGMSEQDKNKKVEYFEQAIKKDPNYALAYHGIFVAYFGPGTRGFHISKEERLKSEWAAMKAAQLDPTLPQVHTALGNIKKYYWDWAGAEKEFKRALELDPNSFLANSMYVAFLADLGRANEAFPYAERGEELDVNHGPLVAYVYLHLRQYDKAIESALKNQKEYPRSSAGRSFQLGEAYVGKGMYDEAIAQMQKAVTVNKEPQRWDGYPMLAFAYGVAGRREEALKILAEQDRLAKEGYISPYNFAIIYTGLGDKDRAFEYLNKACDEHSGPIYHFPYRPMFDSLHSDPRYTALLRKMNLSP